MNISSRTGILVIVAATALLLVGGWWWTDNSSWINRRQAPAEDKTLAPLFEALKSGNVGELDKLLKKNPALRDAQMGEEGTPLHVAARFNQVEVVKLLLDRGASLDTRGQWGGTPLHWACWFGSKDAAKVLMDRGAKLEDKGDIFQSTPLLWVCHGSANVQNPNGDYVGLAELLIAAGASAETSNGDGIPAIVMARPDVAHVLEEHGVKRPETAPTTQDAKQPKGVPI